jgi:2-iminobutanoate/2-iminopropanoate deaminase
MSNLTPIHSDAAPAAIGPYSQAMDTGSLVFCSGQVPLDPATMELVMDSVAAQTDLVMKNLKAVLAEAGLTLSDVAKTTCFLSDMAHFQEMNEVYASHFGDHRPARATVAVAGLPKGVDVEIEVIAVR